MERGIIVNLLFIIDFGQDCLARSSSSESPIFVARYSVWAEVEGKEVVISSASVLSELSDYGVLPVVKLPILGACTGQGK